MSAVPSEVPTSINQPGEAPSSGSVQAGGDSNIAGQNQVKAQTIYPQSIRPEPIELTRHGRTRISVCQTSTPWKLEVDVLVIPVGKGIGLRGSLAQAWFSQLGSSLTDEFRTAVKQAQSQRESPDVTPATPFVVPLTDRFSDVTKARSTILATAFAVDKVGANVDGAALATQAVMRLALGYGLARLGLPLLGSGDAGLSSEKVIRAMIRAVLETPRDPRLAEVILITQEPEIVSTAQAVIRDLLGLRAS